MTQDAHDRWWYIDSIFSHALEVPLEDREAFLEDSCQGDPDLRREVEDLLAAHEASEDFLEDPAEWFEVPFLPGLSPDEPDLIETVPHTGDRIGAYQLLKKIGSGGMGTVYRAKRADGQFKQHVALKLIRQGRRSKETIRRFRLEREILARLQHPNIARLLDGGITDSGLLYFVMEYIDGEPLDIYCEKHELDVKARLDLFFGVCEAVQYAHQNLVVHRDLKPSNILVTKRGKVKLLDFGIAKLIDETERPEAPLTTLPFMTPEYASPEQVLGQPITTASDVYALGLNLYKLLTGYHAYDLTAKSPSEVLQIVCEITPQKPSDVVTQHSKTAANGTTTGPTSRPERLRRQLTGDLDLIVLEALRKEPKRRYSSVGEFADDLRRYLTGQPVKAHEPTMMYRVGKFAQRHRVGLAIAASFALLLIGYAGTLIVKNAQVRKALEKSEQLTEMLVAVFEAPDPEELGRLVTARELLDTWSIERIEAEVPSDPLLQADLMYTLGRTHKGLGLYDESLAYLNAALNRRHTNLPTPHSDIAEVLYELGWLHRLRDDFSEARSFLDQALAMWRALPGHTLEEAENLTELGVLLRQQDNLDEAEQRYQEALALQHRAVQGDHLDIATTLNNLGLIERRRGNTAQAESLYTASYEMRRRLLGDTHPRIVAPLLNLGTLLEGQGRYAEAEALFQQGLTIRQAALGDEHPDLATLLNNMGSLKQTLREFDAAESYYKRALAIERKHYPENHPSLATTSTNLALLNHDQGDYQEAASFYSQALAAKEQRYGAESTRVASHRSLMARFERDRGGYAEAERLFEQAVRVQRLAMPETRYHLSRTLLWYGELRLRQSRATEARSLLEEALALREVHFEAGHRRTAEAAVVLGGCLLELGELDRAEALLVDGYETLLDKQGRAHPRTQEALSYLETLYLAQGRPEQAALYRRDLNETPR